MNAERVLPAGVVAVVLVTTLASGPLVGAVEIPPPSEDNPRYGQGSASVETVTLPDSARITEGRYGSGRYYLRVPDATVELVAVSGRPLIVYRVAIERLGYVRTTTHFVSSANEGRFPLSLERDELDPSVADRDSYEGRVTVLLRANGAERELANRTIPVAVEG